MTTSITTSTSEINAMTLLSHGHKITNQDNDHMTTRTHL